MARAPCARRAAGTHSGPARPGAGACPKQEARGGALDDRRGALRNGTFDERGLEPPRDATALTFREFADIYKQRHVLAKGLAMGKTIDYRLKPLIDRFGERAL